MKVPTEARKSRGHVNVNTCRAQRVWSEHMNADAYVVVYLFKNVSHSFMMRNICLMVQNWVAFFYIAFVQLCEAVSFYLVGLIKS